MILEKLLLSLERGYYCDECSNSSHWQHPPIPIVLDGFDLVPNGDFVKFDHNNYRPNTTKSKEQRKKELEHARLRAWENKYIWRKITKYFHMQKTKEQYTVEKNHEKEWKKSGVKSWKELFNQD